MYLMTHVPSYTLVHHAHIDVYIVVIHIEINLNKLKFKIKNLNYPKDICTFVWHKRWHIIECVK